MKFKVGDKVKVREGLTIGEYYDMDDGSESDSFEGDMASLIGVTMTVMAFDEGKYLLEGDYTDSYWTDGMLEAADSKFAVGTRVKCVAPRERKHLAGKTGTVIAHSIGKNVPLVEFDENVNGHNGLRRAARKGKNGHCWYCCDDELEAIPADKPFDDVLPSKAGVRVRFIGATPHLHGKLGVIKGKHKSAEEVLVEFDSRIVGGHSGCFGSTCPGRVGHCWFCNLTDLEIVTENACETAFEQKIVITSDGNKSTATLYDGDKEIKKAEAAMPEGVDFDFMGCAKRALKALAKEADDKPVSYSGKMVCIESSLESFVPGKIYDCLRGNVKGDDGLTYFPIRKLNHDVTSVFCQLGEKGTKAKFVAVSN